MGNQQGSSNSDFWKIRSKCYNKLQWANNSKYLGEFIKAGNFKKSDIVLDIGTGTGIVAHSLAPLVKEVIGFDKSQDMLEHSNWQGNMYFIKRNIFDTIFVDEIFDKITCRLVFHHILRNRQKAMDICYNMLKKGGKMIFSEGVPPTKRVKKDYVEIFRIKEKRVTFYEEDIMQLIQKSKFKDIKSKTVYLRKMSVKNWLKNSGLPKKSQDKIYDLHKNAASYFKQDYNIIETKNDCLIDMKMVIVTAIK